MIFRKTKTQDLRRTGSWKPKKDGRLFLSRTRSEPEADKSLSATENWVATLPDLPPMRPSKLYYHLHQTCKFYTINRLLVQSTRDHKERIRNWLTDAVSVPDTQSRSTNTCRSSWAREASVNQYLTRPSWSCVAPVNQYMTLFMVTRSLGQPIPDMLFLVTLSLGQPIPDAPLVVMRSPGQPIPEMLFLVTLSLGQPIPDAPLVVMRSPGQPIHDALHGHA